MQGPAELTPGTIVGDDFRVIRLLGTGGMGSVYVAVQHSTGRERALKVMHPMLVADTKLRQRFELEARVGARIESDHVVQVIGAGVVSTSGMPWMAMELLEGESLGERVAQRGALSASEMRLVLGQLFHALSAAHTAGVVHRDLKPDNIFLAASRLDGASMVVKVLDFGIARVVAEARLTTSGFMGTPLWMAPEQMEGALETGPPVDVWALGLIAFACLTGQVFWTAARTEHSAITDLVREVLTDPIVAASARAAHLGCAAGIPPGFDTWFAQCVARDPAHRFQNAGEARAALDPVLVALSTSTPHVTFPSGDGRPIEGATAFAQTAPSAVSEVTGPSRSRRMGMMVAAAMLLLGAFAVVAVVGAFFALRTSFGSTKFGAARDHVDFTVKVMNEPSALRSGFSLRILPHATELDFLEAGRLCTSVGRSPCSETQWEHACQQRREVGQHPVWTAAFSSDGRVVVRGGSRGCASRSLVSHDSESSERATACCTAAALVKGEKRALSRVAVAISGLQSVMNFKKHPLTDRQFGNPIDYFGQTGASRDQVFEAIHKQRKVYPGYWETHVSCRASEDSSRGYKLATCQRVVHQGGVVSAVETRYGFDKRGALRRAANVQSRQLLPKR